MSLLIKTDWDRAKGEIPSWRAKVGDAPALIGALGKKYIELKQYDEAEKTLKRYVELSGDEWAYQELSACYEARGDHNRAKAALDDYLNKTESAGLKHAQVQVQIATDLMKQGRWKEAQPYAEAAAETWAAFGMDCASQCAEGLKDWDRAELWSRRVSERYPRTAGRAGISSANGPTTATFNRPAPSSRRICSKVEALRTRRKPPRSVSSTGRSDRRRRRWI